VSHHYIDLKIWMLRRKRTFRILHFGDQVDLGQIRNGAMHTAAASEAGELHDQRRGDDFMVATTGFNLSKGTSVSY